MERFEFSFPYILKNKILIFAEYFTVVPNLPHFCTISWTTMQRINEVITKLDEIIHEAKIAHSPLGYFAAIYRQMTIANRDGILNGTIDNGFRMEQLDVRFAGRYFAALEAWHQGKPCSASWQKAFDGAKENRLT